MDAYELPEEFAHLQAQDMSKIGFINDIVRGINKVIIKEKDKLAERTYVPAQSNVYNPNIAPLLERAFLFLEDGKWQDANIYCEKDSHKGIIIGKGGAMLKKIGSQARPEIEEMLEAKINLQLWVKVKKDWRDSDFLLKNFGYNEEDR